MGRVIGKAKLRKKLRKIPPEIKESINWAHYKNGQVLTDLQKQWVPKDSGHLRDEHRFAVYQGIVVLRVWVSVFYASFLEFGTIKHSGRPWFYPAYRVLRPRLKARLTREWRKAIKKAVK